MFRQVGAWYAKVRRDIILAGRTRGRGQKVHNLLQALRRLDARDRVLVFGDSDIRPSPSWLRHLVARLDDSRVGASTGFRWYIPQRGNFASVLRSVWNAGAATLFGERKSPFAWGGAMAIRRDTFEACAIAERWQSALSDDYAVTRAMAELGLQIQFVPQALSFTREDCGLRELLDWSFRQLAITRVYKPSLWRLALVSESCSNLTFWGGLALSVVGLAFASETPLLQATLPTLLLASYVLRCMKGWLRTRAIRVLFPDAGTSCGNIGTPSSFGGPSRRSSCSRRR